ncbi:PREDICTED: ras-related protein Rab-32B isoform X2 [Eufriesea mexicana]|uniref:ras-related protein Rab-32B isoform X2 n=1 Tax=Eufriesea mexicana TaxID=516756 RepID=UPI00083C8AB0|nr:PREDICTED: ras-related protein Rab-32B isoform X2 [Eufriesea mexicana]
MDRNESANEGGSSPDTVIARSSSEEERNRFACSTSGEYVTVGDSSSSLDTVTNAAGTTGVAATDPSAVEDKKRGRFGALKSSFRKEGGLFKIRRKDRQPGEPAAEPEPDVEEKETGRKRSPVEEDERKAGGAASSTLKKKKKKSHSLVRKLSLNKFRLSTEQEPRHTPEGGDSSRSQSQSSQESPSLSDSPSRIARKGQETERLGHRDDYEADERRDAPYDADREKGESRKSEKPTEKLSSQNNAPNAGLGEKREHLYKILVIGELGAGKTSIIKRYVHQFFSQHYRATIGVDFALKVLNWDPHTIIRLQLWDIAGQERFGNMTRVYYKEAVGAFIVFDVTRSATLDAVVKWKQDLDSKVQLPDGSPIPCVLLANKCDQQKEGLVNSPTKMDEYCKEKNFAGWFETSAKENINIEEAARFLVNKILQNDQLMKGNGSQEQNDGERFALNQSPTSSKKSCSC